jgi:triphosphatase
MNTETEIKLALPPAYLDAAVAFFTKRARYDGETITLNNIYFDTPDLLLSRTRCALRLRGTPSGWLQTFKTGGDASAGMHRRGEWEMPVAQAALDIDALLNACNETHATRTLAKAAPHLIPLFRTDFTRRSWQMTGEHINPHAGVDPATRIEAAIDLGAVTAEIDGTTRRAPIHEIELELKHGDDSALLALAAEIRGAIPELEPDNVSKAERGYRLRSGKAL